MTARVRGAEVSQYLELGAIGVVPKPFDPVTLAAEIRNVSGPTPGRQSRAPPKARPCGEKRA